MLNNKISRILALSFFCLLTPFVNIVANTVPLDKVVAIVNNSVVTQSQLNNTIQSMTQQLQAEGKPVPADAELRKKALDQAIGEILQLQIAERANVKVNDADVDKAMARIAEGNHLTIDQLKQALQQQGISYTNYRHQIHDQLQLQVVQQQALASKVQVTQADIQAFIKQSANQTQYHLDDLLIPLSESATQEQVDAADKQVNELIQQARNGITFSHIAGLDNKIQHNDLQWRTLSDLPDVFTNIVSQMKVGDIAGPVKAPNGFHILQLLEVKGPSNMTDAEVKQIVFQRKLQEQAKEWAQELRKNAYVKIM